MNRILVILSVLVFTSGCVFENDIYSVGGDQINLVHVPGSKLYIDQFERTWALVKTNNHESPLKAIPAGNNKCLLEFNYSDLHSSKINPKDYIMVDNVCLLKFVDSKKYNFNKANNTNIAINKELCPQEYELTESSNCLRKNHQRN